MIDYNKNALDVFRLIATLQVFLGHVISHFMMTDPPFDAVYFVRGVPILFVLCGFLTAKSLEGKDRLQAGQVTFHGFSMGSTIQG